jgi:hypothetical protein
MHLGLLLPVVQTNFTLLHKYILNLSLSEAQFTMLGGKNFYCAV